MQTTWFGTHTDLEDSIFSKPQKEGKCQFKIKKSIREGNGKQKP